jgi:hypothetical protein
VEIGDALLVPGTYQVQYLVLVVYVSACLGMVAMDALHACGT